MGRIDKLVDDFEEAVRLHFITAGMDAPFTLKEGTLNKMEQSREALLKYVNAMKDSMCIISEISKDAIQGEDEYDMIEERNTIIDEINREGFEIFDK